METLFLYYKNKKQKNKQTQKIRTRIDPETLLIIGSHCTSPGLFTSILLNLTKIIPHLVKLLWLDFPSLIQFLADTNVLCCSLNGRLEKLLALSWGPEQTFPPCQGVGPGSFPIGSHFQNIQRCSKCQSQNIHCMDSLGYMLGELQGRTLAF